MISVMSSTDKRQFLDPISTISRIILLHFSPPKTKIRITDHTVQLTDGPYHWLIEATTPHWFAEATTRKIKGDSRNDICYLYPIFVRFIELYLLEKHKKSLEKGSNKSALVKVASTDGLNESKMFPEDTCYKYLKKLAEYAIVGMTKLQKTYGYDNASFTIQYFILLLKDGIKCEYTTEYSLPESLRELTKNNLLDDTKVQKIWEDSHLIDLGRTFEQCFKAEKNNDPTLLSANKKKIMDILDARDSEFRKMLGTDMTESR
jgi:hypothetical protein